MSNTVIKVENLGKQYRIFHENKDPYKKLSDTLIDFVQKCVKPWRFFNNKEAEVFKALDDINFEIKRGEKVAIIGRNGAGKSTLLKVLSRITEPTEGSVKIKGRVASLLEVGTGFHPELTGRENIFLNGAVLGMAKNEIKKKFDDIVEFSGCEKFLDTPVKRYSSGMKMRLGFAVAAHLESEILIVDEVLAVGDAEFQKKCLGKMDEISKGEGRTIIFVSHNMSAVQNLCDKGIVVEKGRVKFSGKIEKAVDVYLTEDENKYNLLDKSKELDDFKNDFLVKDDLEINLSFNLTKAYKKVFCDLAIFDNKDNKLAHLRMINVSDFLDLSVGTNKLKFNIEPMNLTPGKYYAKIMIATKGKAQILLHLKDLLLFEIKGSNADLAILKTKFQVRKV